MPFAELHYFSNCLAKQTACNVILPEIEAGRRYPVMYLLHGLSDDYTIWCRRTSIERYAEGLALIIVMPDGGRSLYSNTLTGQRYEDALAIELPEMIDRIFPTLTSREGRCLTGLSMGGYGALKFAMKYPDRFGSCVSHSGAMNFGNEPNLGGTEREAEFRMLVGETPAGGPNDLFAIAEQIDRNKLPAIRIDCGTEDFLLNHNRRMAKHLNKSGHFA